MEDYWTISVSGYAGYEDEVLRVRNNNRPDIQTRAYMDWRYLGQKTRYSPIILWVQHKDGTRIGMASLIFRPFWVDNAPKDVAVLGDISLNAEFRGRGIAQRLFGYMNSLIDKESCPCGFVMPNPPAQRSLSAVGWKICELLVAHVLLINPEEKLFEILRNRSVARFLGQIFRNLTKLWLRLSPQNDLSIRRVSTIDSSFDKLWQRIAKNGMIISDRSSPSLAWRYLNNPNASFEIVKLSMHDVCVGYIICSLDAIDSSCNVYDLLVEDTRHLKPAFAWIVETLGNVARLDYLRVFLNKSHPYSRALSRIGFVTRKMDTSFQIYCSADHVGGFSNHWFICAGDKDV